MSLAAFYAPRGIPPAQVLAASPSELAFLAESRAMYYEETQTMIQAAICAAFANDKAKEG